MSKSSQTSDEKNIESLTSLATGIAGRFVVKLGGSLFDLPDLRERIERLGDRYAERVLLVPGGGQFATELRRLDDIHHWTDQHAHQMGLQAMALAARMIAGSDSRFQLVDAVNEHSWNDSERKIGVLDVIGLPGVEDLPASWDVTSDSIAAWVALRLGNGRLLMAKSIDLPEPVPGFQAAAQSGLVDRAFPGFAAKLHQLQWVNLRDDELRVQSWTNANS